MTAVLLFGDIPNTGHVPRSGTERVSVGDAEGAVPPDAVIDLVRHRLQAKSHVVALYPTWQPEPALRSLRLTRASLATERLVITPSSLPPLALSLIGDQLGYLAPYCPPGALVAIMSALERVTLSGAWLRSVTGLEHVPASMSDHVASYVPGGGFMVTVSPSQRIHRVTGSTPLGELPYYPADPVHVLTAGSEGGDTDWVQSHLLPALRAQHVRPVAPPPLAETYWGTKKYVEFVAFSGHPKALSVIANSVRCRPCPWCGEPVGTPTCPLCGMVAPHRPVPSQAPQNQEPPAPPDPPQPRGPAAAPDSATPAPPRTSEPPPTQAIPRVPDSRDPEDPGLPPGGQRHPEPPAPAPPSTDHPTDSQGPGAQPPSPRHPAEPDPWPGPSDRPDPSRTSGGDHRAPGPPDRTDAEETRYGRHEAATTRMAPVRSNFVSPSTNAAPAHTSNGAL